MDVNNKLSHIFVTRFIFKIYYDVSIKMYLFKKTRHALILRSLYLHT